MKIKPIIENSLSESSKNKILEILRYSIIAFLTVFEAVFIFKKIFIVQVVIIYLYVLYLPFRILLFIIIDLARAYFTNVLLKLCEKIINKRLQITFVIIIFLLSVYTSLSFINVMVHNDVDDVFDPLNHSTLRYFTPTIFTVMTFLSGIFTFYFAFKVAPFKPKEKYSKDDPFSIYVFGITTGYYLVYIWYINN